MKRNMVTGLAILLGFLGCAVEQPNSTVADNAAAESQDQNPSANQALTGDWTCTQKGGWLTATSTDGITTSCGPLMPEGSANLCSPEKGCQAYSGTPIIPAADLAVNTHALTLDDGNINPLGDCSGNCGPINLVWCGDASLPNGQAYAGRWICMAWIDQAGDCRMKGVEMACSVGDTCERTGAYPSYGQCIAPVECRVAAECNDNVQCTIDTCDAVGNCQHTPKFGTVDASCDDGNLCSIGDTCDAFNRCTGTEKPCNDANPCTTDSCDQATGNCLNGNLPDTTACDDANACTLQDVCTAGRCTGTEKPCNDANPCTTDSCDQANGTCLYDRLPNGTVCGLPAANEVCVEEACQSHWCVRGDTDTCQQDAETGTLGYWQCQLQIGADFGTWIQLELCGTIGNAACVNGAGCVNPGAREVACHDGVDNDGDGRVDCLDLDCAGLAFCQSVTVCHAQAECPAAEGCCAGGNICAPDCFLPPVPLPCVDADHDGFDNCAIGVAGGDAFPVDCDDASAAKHPGAVEICDGLDNDCDNAVDNQIVGAALLCVAGQVCTAGHCVAGPECVTNANCLAGWFCAAGTCVGGVDLHGRTGPNESGANAGMPDQKDDRFDWDADCFVGLSAAQMAAGLRPLGTSAAPGVCPVLNGGDCDDSATGWGNNPSVADWIGDHYDNNCDGTIQ